MDKNHLISILVPSISLILIAIAFFAIRPETTGLVVMPPNGTKLVNADVTLITKSNEVIPPDAIVEVEIDGLKDKMTVSNFIIKTGMEYQLANANLTDFGYFGPGFTGDYSYKLNLSDFKINRDIGKGEHRFITRIIYHNHLLYEKENRIMISE